MIRDRGRLAKGFTVPARIMENVVVAVSDGASKGLPAILEIPYTQVDLDRGLKKFKLEERPIPGIVLREKHHLRASREISCGQL